MDQTCDVWVNGEPVGRNHGGYLPFTCDVTTALRDGENTLVLRVRDLSEGRGPSSGKQRLARGVNCVGMKPETRSFYQHAVQRSIERIAANLDDAIELQALAKSAALSPFHFHRVFRGMVGETPLELMRRLKDALDPAGVLNPGVILTSEATT